MGKENDSEFIPTENPPAVVGNLREQSVEDTLTTLRRTIEGMQSFLLRHASEMPKGVRYEVVVNPMTTLEGSAIPANPGDLDLYREWHINPHVRQRLGILTVSGIGTGTLDFDYHSTSKAPDFRVKLGTHTATAEGQPPDVAYRALSQLLATLPGRGQDNQQGFYLTSRSNAEFTDRSGFLHGFLHSRLIQGAAQRARQLGRTLIGK